MSKLQDIRKDYKKHQLLEGELLATPFLQFEAWFQEALNAQVNEPNAMTLATVTDNKPHSRVVLLKGLEQEQFIFFTNYNSKKGHEIASNPEASLLFFWPELERQIRIEGTLQKTSAEYSDQYFSVRPRASQIGAIASKQSSVLKSREELEQKVEELTQQFGENPIQRPENWGGYALQANYFEFWQGRPSRLHDRIVFTKNEHNNWEITRLYP